MRIIDRSVYVGPSLYALSLIPVRFTQPGYPMIPGSQYWSLATYMLLHGSWMHLAFNCIWLLIFGTPVARYLGSAKFLLLTLASGVLGGLCSLLLHWGQETIIVGASALHWPLGWPTFLASVVTAAVSGS